MSKKMTELQAELEQIISWFESDEADIDKVEAQYERGLAIAKELEERLQETKNRIVKLQQTFDDR